jgi:hypothetical protein
MDTDILYILLCSQLHAMPRFSPHPLICQHTQHSPSIKHPSQKLSKHTKKIILLQFNNDPIPGQKHRHTMPKQTLLLRIRWIVVWRKCRLYTFHRLGILTVEGGISRRRCWDIGCGGGKIGPRGCRSNGSILHIGRRLRWDDPHERFFRGSLLLHQPETK